jgi:hypothetical protein
MSDWKRKSAVLAAMLLPAVGFSCQLTWDTPANVEWIESIAFFRDGVEVGTAPPTPPADCADIGVTPCWDCIYTARFRRGEDESPDSEPAAIELSGPMGITIRPSESTQ